MDWWNPSRVYSGGSFVANYSVPLARFPVFHRKGSILPLDVTNDEGNHGDERSSGYLTLLISHLSPGAYQSVREEATASNPIAQEFRYGYDGGVFTFTATAHSRKLLLLIRGVTAEGLGLHSKGNGVLPRQESLGALHSQASGWHYDDRKGELWIIPGDSSSGLVLIATGMGEKSGSSVNY